MIIGDLVQSKKIKNREKVQVKLKDTLEKINREKKDSIIAPLVLVRGDEFEGAFKNAAACYKAFVRVERSIYPSKVHGGIGIGRINTELSESVMEMDGPAFHHAREALKKLKRAKSGIFIHSDDPELDGELNTILDLLWAIRSGWTQRQRKMVDHYLTHEVPYGEVAKHFEITQSAVSRILSRAHLKAVERAEEFLTAKLSELGEEEAPCES